MKSTNIIQILCISMLVLASCREVEEEYATDTMYLKITADIEGAATRINDEATRFDEDDVIHLYVAGENVFAYYRNGQWVLDRDVTLTTTSIPVYACFNRDGGSGNPTIFFSGYYSELYGTSDKEVSVTNPEAHILFQHVQARITLSIQCGPSDSGARLYEVYLRNTKDNAFISTYGEFDLPTGKFINTNSGDVSVTPNIYLDSDAPQNVDLYVLPTEIPEDGMAEFVFMIDGFPYTIPIPATKWESGQQYTYPITINRK